MALTTYTWNVTVVNLTSVPLNFWFWLNNNSDKNNITSTYTSALNTSNLLDIYVNNTLSNDNNFINGGTTKTLNLKYSPSNETPTYSWMSAGFNTYISGLSDDDDLENVSTTLYYTNFITDNSAFTYGRYPWYISPSDDNNNYNIGYGHTLIIHYGSTPTYMYLALGEEQGGPFTHLTSANVGTKTFNGTSGVVSGDTSSSESEETSEVAKSNSVPIYVEDSVDEDYNLSIYKNDEAINIISNNTELSSRKITKSSSRYLLGSIDIGQEYSDAFSMSITNSNDVDIFSEAQSSVCYLGEYSRNNILYFLLSVTNSNIILYAIYKGGAKSSLLELKETIEGTPDQRTFKTELQDTSDKIGQVIEKEYSTPVFHNRITDGDYSFKYVDAASKLGDWKNVHIINTDTDDTYFGIKEISSSDKSTTDVLGYIVKLTPETFIENTYLYNNGELIVKTNSNFLESPINTTVDSFTGSSIDNDYKFSYEYKFSVTKTSSDRPNYYTSYVHWTNKKVNLGYEISYVINGAHSENQDKKFFQNILNTYLFSVPYTKEISDNKNVKEVISTGLASIVSQNVNVEKLYNADFLLKSEIDNLSDDSTNIYKFENNTYNLLSSEQITNVKSYYSGSLSSEQTAYCTLSLAYTYNLVHSISYDGSIQYYQLKNLRGYEKATNIDNIIQDITKEQLITYISSNLDNDKYKTVIGYFVNKFTDEYWSVNTNTLNYQLYPRVYYKSNDEYHSEVLSFPSTKDNIDNINNIFSKKTFYTLKIFTNEQWTQTPSDKLDYYEIQDAKVQYKKVINTNGSIDYVETTSSSDKDIWYREDPHDTCKKFVKIDLINDTYLQGLLYGTSENNNSIMSLITLPIFEELSTGVYTKLSYSKVLQLLFSELSTVKDLKITDLYKIINTTEQIYSATPLRDLDFNEPVYTLQWLNDHNKTELLYEQCFDYLDDDLYLNDRIDRYKLSYAYTSLSSSVTDIETVKKVTFNIQNNINLNTSDGVDKYWKKNEDGTYSPYTYSEISTYTSLPLNLYSKNIFFEKTSSTYQYDILYTPKYNYVEAEKDNITTKEDYYIYYPNSVSHAYVQAPVGIIKNRSVEYYAYQYVKADADFINNVKYRKISDLKSNEKLYVKNTKYTYISSTTEADYYKKLGAKFYKINFEFVRVEDNAILFDGTTKYYIRKTDLLQNDSETLSTDSFDDYMVVDDYNILNIISSTDTTTNDEVTNNSGWDIYTSNNESDIINIYLGISDPALSRVDRVGSTTIISKDSANNITIESLNDTIKSLYKGFDLYTCIVKYEKQLSSTSPEPGMYAKVNQDTYIPVEKYYVTNNTSISRYFNVVDTIYNDEFYYYDCALINPYQIYNIDQYTYYLKLDNYDDDSTYTLKEIDSYGFIKDPEVKYFHRYPVVTRTLDIHLNRNKKYYTFGSVNKITGNTDIISMDNLSISKNTCYISDTSSAKQNRNTYGNLYCNFYSTIKIDDSSENNSLDLYSLSTCYVGLPNEEFSIVENNTIIKVGESTYSYYYAYWNGTEFDAIVTTDSKGTSYKLIPSTSYEAALLNRTVKSIDSIVPISYFTKPDYLEAYLYLTQACKTEDSPLYFNKAYLTNIVEDYNPSIVSSNYVDFDFSYVKDNIVELSYTKWNKSAEFDHINVLNSTALTIKNYISDDDLVGHYICNIDNDDYDINDERYYKDSSYTFDWKNIQYYTKTNPRYSILGPYTYSYVYTYVWSKYKEDEYPDLFIGSKYYYQNDILSSGINISKNGSLYTKLSVFDGTQGTIGKTVVFDTLSTVVTQYTYSAYAKSTFDKYVKVSYVSLDKQLYYVKNTEDVKYEEYEDIFNDWLINPSLFDDNLELYIDKNEGSNNHQYESVTTSSVLDTFNQVDNSEDDRITTYYLKKVNYHPATSYDFYNLPASEVNTYSWYEKISDATYTYQDVYYTRSDKSDAYVSEINNNFFGIYKIEKTLQSDGTYAYSVVKSPDLRVVLLSYQYTENTYSSNNILTTEKMTSSSLGSKSLPFAFKNDVELVFTGSYIWNAPKDNYVIYQKKDSTTGKTTYEYKFVRENDGYWEKEVKENVIPLQIAAYNFETNTFGNTYMYFPQTYIVHAIKEHPTITYDFKAVDYIEEFTYTFYDTNHRLNEFTPTPSRPVIEGEDGTYWGVVNNVKVQLAKKPKLTKYSTVKNIVHQNQTTDIEYVSYKSSLALCNAVRPILYNSSLNPSTTHDILTWNKETNTYEIKTVIDTYAYYSYDYYYETIPLVTTSYLFQGGKLYIEDITDISNSLLQSYSMINGYMMRQTTAIEHIDNTLYNTLVNSYVAQVEAMNYLTGNVTYAYTEIGNLMVKDAYTIAYSVNDLSYQMTSYISTSSYNVVHSLDTFDKDFKSYILKVNSTLNKEIPNNAYVVKTSVNDLSYQLHQDLFDNTITFANPDVYQLTYQQNRNGIISYQYYNDDWHNHMIKQGTTKKVSTLSDLLLEGLFTEKYVEKNYTQNGLLLKESGYVFSSISDILEDLKVSPRIPKKKEFLYDVATKIFINSDFDWSYTAPQVLARRALYRAKALWNTLEEAYIVS